MVGAEAGGVAPKIGAPIKRNVEMSDLPMKPRRKHPRKTSKKTRERYKKIRERAEKRGDMDIIKPQKTPAAV